MKKNSPKNKDLDLEKSDLFNSIEKALTKRQKSLMYFSLFLYLIFTILIFQPLVSLGGDDSSYIVRAVDFIKKFEFPSYQGALYPIVLSFFVLIFGVNVVLLKALSLIFLFFFIYFFYKAFKGRVPNLILTFCMFFFSVNYSLLYFSSQTYNEAFFIFLQIIFIGFFFKNFIEKEISEKFNSNIKEFALLGLFLLLLGITRSIAYAAFLGVTGYFVLNLKWNSAIKTIASFGCVYFIYSILKGIIWGSKGADFSSQGAGLLYKDYYNRSAGREDLAGFIQRIIDNANLYLSKHFAVFSSMRSEQIGMKIIPFLTVLIILLFIFSMVISYKRNKFLFFIAIYTIAIVFSSFVVLQKNWDQARLIIPYSPFILLVILMGIYHFFKIKKAKSLQFILVILFAVMFFSSFKTISKKAKANSELKGPWYDLTPDWINYIKCSRWAAKNVPIDAKIVCRKSSVSVVYSNGREFSGIYSFNTFNTKELMNGLPDSIFIVAPYNQVFGKEVPFQAQILCKQTLAFILNNNGDITGLFNPVGAQKEFLKNNFRTIGINYSESPKNFIANINKDISQSYVVSPDTLINYFKTRDIDYIIKASLRMNPYAKTGRTINTIERYIIFIEQKYPGIFEKVIQMGGDQDEPASLYRINYAKYNL